MNAPAFPPTAKLRAVASPRAIASALTLACAGFLSLATGDVEDCFGGKDATRTLLEAPPSGELELSFDSHAEFVFVAFRPAVSVSQLLQGSVPTFTTHQEEEHYWDARTAVFSWPAPPLCDGIRLEAPDGAGGAGGSSSAGGSANSAPPESENGAGTQTSSCMVPVLGGQLTRLLLTDLSPLGTRVTFHVGTLASCESPEGETALRIISGVQ